MSILSSLYVRLGLDAEGFTSGMQSVSRQINSAMSESNKALSGFNRLGRAMSDVGQSMTVGLTLPLVGFGAAAIKSAADIESLKMGLDAVMGSSKLASEEMKKLKVVAELPGLGFEEAIQGSVRLQAVGYSASEAREALQNFGNAIATTGGGRAELDRVITQLTQMASAGKLLTQDLRPVIQTVPLLGGVLLDLYGTIDASEINEQLTEQGLSAKDFVNVVTTELGKLPTVTGGLGNAFENLSDTTKQALGNIGTALKPFVETAIPLLSGAIVQLSDAFTGLPPAMQSTVVVTGSVVAALGPLLLIGGKLITSFLSFKALLATYPVILKTVGAGVAGLKTALAALATPLALIAGAFAGWQLGKWAHDNLRPAQKFGDWLGSLVMRAPSVQVAIARMSGAFDALTHANDDLDFATQKLKRSLENQGIHVERGSMSASEYASALREAAKNTAEWHKGAAFVGPVLEEIKNKIDPLTDSVDDHTKKVELSEEAWFKWYAAASGRSWEPPPIPDFTAAINDANEALWNSVPPLTAAGGGFSELSGGILQSAEDLAATTPKFEESAKRTETAWDQAMQNVSTNITNAAQKITGILIGTQKGSIGDAFKELGRAVVTSFTEPAIKAISDFVSGAIKDLIGALIGKDGVGGALGTLKDAFKGIFGGGGGTPSVSTGGGGSAAGGLGSSIGSAVGGFAAGFNVVAGGVQMYDTRKMKQELEWQTELFSLWYAHMTQHLKDSLDTQRNMLGVLLSWGGDTGIFGQINDAIRIDLSDRIKELREAVLGGGGFGGVIAAVDNVVGAVGDSAERTGRVISHAIVPLRSGGADTQSALIAAKVLEGYQTTDSRGGIGIGRMDRGAVPEFDRALLGGVGADDRSSRSGRSRRGAVVPEDEIIVEAPPLSEDTADIIETGLSNVVQGTDDMRGSIVDARMAIVQSIGMHQTAMAEWFGKGISGIAGLGTGIVDAITGTRTDLGARLDTIATETRGVKSAIQTLQINVTASSEASGKQIADAIALRLQGVTV